MVGLNVSVVLVDMKVSNASGTTGYTQIKPALEGKIQPQRIITDDVTYKLKKIGK